jgi:hypothetical protein
MRSAAQFTALFPERRLELSESVIVFVAAAILLVAAVFWADKPPTMEKTDFSVTYIGSRMVYLGMGPKLYDLDEQRKLKSSLLKNAEPLIYEHPPFEALLLAPLGALPYKTAYLVWGLINVAVWLILPYLMRPYAPMPQDGLGYSVLWFLFAPLGITLFQGQSSLVLLLLFAITLIQLKGGHERTAGLCLGLGLFKFQFVLPFALIFLLRRKWRFTTGFALSAAVLGILSFATVGWAGILNYIKLLAVVSSHPANVSYGSATDMATLQGFVHALLRNSANGLIIRLTVAALSLFLVALVAWSWNRAEHNRASFDLIFAIAIVVSLITGFHMFAHDLSPLLLAMLLVMPQIPKQGSVGLRVLLWSTLVFFWIPPIYFVLIAHHCMYLLFPLLVIFGGGTLKLAVEAGSDHADPGSALQKCF